MNILVTGAAGFIGFHVTRQLLARGDRVIGIDNINDYYDISLKHNRLAELGVTINNNELSNQQDSIDSNITHDVDIFNNYESIETTSYQKYHSTIFEQFDFVKLDIADQVAMGKLFSEFQVDAVCHLAAQAGVRYSLENPHAYINSNITGFINVLESCRQYKVSNLCFASSSSVYGLNRSQPFKTSDHTDHPVSLYAATKKSNEMMAHTYSHLYGIKTTGLRFFTVYGPWGRPDMAPILFADAMRLGQPIKVFNHGNMSRDFTYIDDIVTGIIGIIDNPACVDIDFNALQPKPDSSSAPYAIYNIGNNHPVSLKSFIEILETAFDNPVQKIMMDMQPGDVESTYADASLLYEKLGFAPNTSLEEGVNAFARWYSNYYIYK